LTIQLRVCDDLPARPVEAHQTIRGSRARGHPNHVAFTDVGWLTFLIGFLEGDRPQAVTTPDHLAARNSLAPDRPPQAGPWAHAASQKGTLT